MSDMEAECRAVAASQDEQRQKLVDTIKDIHRAAFKDGEVNLANINLDNDNTQYVFNGTEEELMELIKLTIFEDPETVAYAKRTDELLTQFSDYVKEKENEANERQILMKELEKELALLEIEYEAACQRTNTHISNNGTSDVETDNRQSILEPATSSDDKTPHQQPPAADVDDDIEVVQEISSSSLMPELANGMSCYAVKQADLWKKAIIVGCVPASKHCPDQIDSYRVRISGHTRLVKKHQIAYVDPPKRSLKLGTRVIALYRDSTGTTDFFSGIIAEPPFQNNNYRYLIFFDDGCAQYIHQKDIRVITHQFSSPWTGLQSELQEFIENYMNTYNERRILKMSVGQTVRCERNGQWLKARCLIVDCSLVKVLFEVINRTEWLYRGSTRFEPLFALQNQMDKNKNDGPRSATASARSAVTSAFSESSRLTHQRPAQKQKRQLAYKSTRPPKTLVYNPPSTHSLLARNDQLMQQQQLQHQQPQPIDGKEHSGNRIKVESPKVPLTQFVPHECGPSCIKLNDDPSSFRGIYSQAIPIHAGFERFICRTKRTQSQYTGNKKFIVYRGPCGRRIRNMKEMGDYLSITSSRLTIDLFSFEVSLHMFEPFVATHVIVKTADISGGVESVPISCVNALNAVMPDPLKYANVRMPQKDVNLNTNTDFMVCCDCTDNCQDKSKCACQQLTYEGQKFLQPSLPLDKSGYTYRRLEENIITGLYECNSKCSCRKTCFNRVAQNALSVRLQIFKTEKRGWGLRCLDDVPTGGFICIYAGQLLSEEGADQGGREYGDEYFAELDFIETCESVKEGYEQEVIGSSDDERDKSDSDWEESSSGSGSDTNDGFHFLGNKSLRSKNKVKTKTPPATEEKNSEGSPKAADAKGSNTKSIRAYFDEEMPYVMDAKTSGNLGRYLNHSCDPNVFVQNVFVDTHDPRFPWIAFFANTFIRAGTELTWDYGYQPGIVEGKTMYCYCGSSNCRGRLL